MRKITGRRGEMRKRGKGESGREDFRGLEEEQDMKKRRRREKKYVRKRKRRKRKKTGRR